MGKDTAIKVSSDFKKFLVDKKLNNEDFEATIKRLVNHPLTRSVPVNHAVNRSVNQLTNINKQFIILNLNKITPGLFIKKEEENKEQEIIGFTESGKKVLKRTNHLFKVKDIPICEFEIIRENIPFQIPIKNCLGERL